MQFNEASVHLNSFSAWFNRAGRLSQTRSGTNDDAEKNGSNVKAMRTNFSYCRLRQRVTPSVW